jgi:hypothetical protein
VLVGEEHQQGRGQNGQVMERRLLLFKEFLQKMASILMIYPIGALI